MSIASELNRLLQAKSDLATSIAAKGVTVPASATLDDYPALVDSIQQGGSSLPYDAEVKWLKSDGSAYINTGINATSSIRVVAEFTILSGESSNCALYGARVANQNSSNVLFYQVSNGRWSWRYGNVNKDISATLTGSFVTSNRASARIMGIIGASNVSITSNTASFTTTYPMYLFCMNNGGANSYASPYFEIESAKMYDGSTLVRSYIPVRKNGVGYLYDKVSGQLFGNANSTGAFTYGSDTA